MKTRSRLDEDDVRVRPGRGSRPRTRTRPAHSSAAAGLVIAVDRGRYRVVIGSREVTAMKARELGKGSVVVGDRVALAGDASGSAGSLARIVRIEPRTSALRRSADDTDPVERVLVANADQMVIVSSLVAPGLRFVDRCLVAAFDAGVAPLLVLTKADLASVSQRRSVRALYRPLGVPMISTRKPLPAVTMGRLRSALSGRVSVFIGQSGVGKSTLVNTLVPDASRAVGEVNPVTGRGRHTSSSAVAFAFGAAAWIIDTPGLRGFGLGHVSPARLVAAFEDLAEGVANCPPGCDHLGDDRALDGRGLDSRGADGRGADGCGADGCGTDGCGADGCGTDGCALDAWAAERGLGARLDSLRRLLTSRASATRPDP